MNIEDISEVNNWAYINIVGTVVSTPRYFPREHTNTGTLYFDVDDGTGTITVRAYDTATRELIEKQKIPAFGDKVDLKGVVNVRKDQITIVLNSADQLKIIREPATAISISELYQARTDENYFIDGTRVKIKGTIDYWVKYKFALSLWLSDDYGNQANIFIPQSIIELTGPGILYTITEDMEISATGALKWYAAGRYSRWEIIPATTADIYRIYPELIVTNLTYPEEPIEPGVEIYIYANILNNGDSTAIEVPVIFYADTMVLGVMEVDELRAGDSIELTVNWTVPSGLTYIELTVVVDPDNIIMESNEANNELRTIITIRS
jgi:hypothetical protein